MRRAAGRSATTRATRSAGWASCASGQRRGRPREPAPTWPTGRFRSSARSTCALLDGLGERLVVTQQDLIAFHNPAYFEAIAGLAGHRALTRAGAGRRRPGRVLLRPRARGGRCARSSWSRARAGRAASAPTTGSPPRPAPQPPLGPERRRAAVPAVPRHRLPAQEPRVRAPPARSPAGRARLGRHLVLAGPKVAQGARRARKRPSWHGDRLADHVVDLAAVNEAEKALALERAAAVAYPTTSEGFGLVPFEAGDAGVPCVRRRDLAGRGPAPRTPPCWSPGTPRRAHGAACPCWRSLLRATSTWPCSARRGPCSPGGARRTS